VADLAELLTYLMEQRGSDLLVKVGSRPHIRMDGKLHLTTIDPMAPAEIESVVAELLPVSKAEELVERGEVDVAHSVPGVGRFRVNVYRQRGSLSLAIRRVVPGAPPISHLALPPVVEKLASEETGLLIVAGPAASGKTTTVAAVIDHINTNKAKHIVTLEDPVEVLHTDKQSLVSQREVGTDIGHVADALRSVGRQNADVIFVSEVTDAETVKAAISEASAGRLVIITMTTLSAVETVSRLVDFVAPHQERQLRHSLASVLRGVICQRLLDRADGRGRVPAVELLVNTSRVFDAIVTAQPDSELERLIDEGEYYGMQSFDQSLFQLYRDNLVTLRDALSAASRPEDLRIAFQAAGLTAVS
jgi:twitching motility protein PilT